MMYAGVYNATDDETLGIVLLLPQKVYHAMKTLVVHLQLRLVLT